MNISELEEILRKEGLLEVHVGSTVKRYVSGGEGYEDGEWHNCVDVFGIYKSESGRFHFFITESERGGIPDYSHAFDTEEEACEDLLKKIRLEDRIYKNKLVWYTEKYKN